MDKHSTSDFKQRIAQRLETKFPNFESDWKEVVNSLGPEFVNTFRARFKAEKDYLTEVSKFELIIVIDNNFIFGQIKGLLNKSRSIKDSFLFKLSKSNLTKVYAPPKIKEEVYRIIDREISENQRIAAKRLAEKLLGLIEIEEAFWVDDWKKAHRAIGHLDNDDTPYFALAFSLKSHGIISFDKHFHKQGDINVWDITDTGKIISTYNEGFISFCCIAGIFETGKMLYHIIVMIFKFIGEVFVEILQALILVGSDVITILSKIPKQIYALVVGFLLVGLAISEDARSKFKHVLNQLGDNLRNLLEKFGEILQSIIEFLQNAWKAFEPYGITTLEITGYLLANYEIMVEEIDRLEKERPR